MKIALLLTGGLRNFEHTYNSFKHFLFDRLDIDVFFYGLENKFGKDQNEIKFVELFKPIRYVINKKCYYDQLPVDPKYIKSSYFSFYNVYQCNQLKKKYQESNNVHYDRVIRCRLDAFWFRSITDHELDLAKNCILTPQEWSFKQVNNFALSDIFCITNNQLIDKYCDLFQYIDEYCQKFTNESGKKTHLSRCHPESLIGYHLMIQNIPSLEIPRHFVMEYPTEKTHQFIPPGYKFVDYFDGQNRMRKDFD